MALTVDGGAAFGPGPHEVVAGAVQREAKTTLFPGLSGVFLLTLGGDREEIAQAGVLTASGASAAAAESAVQDLKDGLNALVLSGTHSLVDDYGRTYAGVVLLEWRPIGPRQLVRNPTAGTWTVRQPYAARWLAADLDGGGS